MTEKEVVENLLEIRNMLRKKYDTLIVTPFQELKLAAQVQHNLFLHQANFLKSRDVPGQYEHPIADATGVLVDIHTQLESIVELMEQKSSG